MKTVARISFAIFVLSVPFLLFGFGAGTLRIIRESSITDGRWIAFLTGVAIFIPTYFIARRLFESVWNWLETFEHEFTHLLIGLVFFKLPVGFRVTAHQGGEVKYVGRGTTGHTWITLAPYFFPTVSIFVVLAAFVAGLDSKYLLGALGWTTAFHLVTNWSETSFRQPDLKKAGIGRTLAVLPVMNLICYGSVAAFVAGGVAGFISFWKIGFAESVAAAGYLTAKFWI